MLAPGWKLPEKINRILVIQPHNSLGDHILSLPLLDEIHHAWPSARIDVIAGAAMSTLYDRITYIDRVIIQSSLAHRPPLTRYLDTLGLIAHLRSLSCGQYDLAVDTRWDSDDYAYLARLIAFITGAPHRIGYSGRVDGRDPSLDHFLTRPALGGSLEHEVIRKLRLLERVDLNDRKIEDSQLFSSNITLSEIARKDDVPALQLLRASGLKSDERYIVLAPSASSPMRIWSIERLCALVEKISTMTGLKFVIIGSAADVELCHRVSTCKPSALISMAGKTSLLEMCSIISRAALFIGNDSGPAHVSGMLGVDTVVISPYPASSNGLDHANAPARFRPCGPRVIVIQPDKSLAPCGDFCHASTAHCINQITQEQVFSACAEFLSGGRMEYRFKHSATEESHCD